MRMLSSGSPTAPDRKVVRTQRIILAGMSAVVLLLAAFFIRSSDLDSWTVSEMKSVIKASDTVNRDLTQGDWIARSEAELREMQSRISLLEKQAMGPSSVSAGPGSGAPRATRFVDEVTITLVGEYSGDELLGHVVRVRNLSSASVRAAEDVSDFSPGALALTIEHPGLTGSPPQVVLFSAPGGR